MSTMNVTLPNGTVISGVPEGASKEDIKAKAISAGLATEADFNTPAQPPETVQTPERPYGEQIASRFEQYKPSEILGQAIPEFQRRQEIMAGELGSTGFGEDIQLGFSQAVRTGGELLTSFAGVFVSDAVREGAEDAWNAVKDTSFGRLATEALSSGYDSYLSLKEKYPSEVERLEQIVDIGAIITPQVGVSSAANRAKQKYNLNNFEERKKGVERMMRPDNFEGEGEVVEVGRLRKKEYLPSNREETVNLTLATVDSVDPNRSYTYNHQAVNKEVEASNEKLIGFINRSKNPKFNLNEVVREMQDAVTALSAAPEYRLLTGDAQKKANEFAETALDMLRESEGNALSLLEVRRQFDKFLSSGQKTAFDPTIESSKSVAGRYIRNVLNNKLKELTPGDDVQNYLDRMHNLLNAKDTLRKKRAKEASNVITRAWSSVKDVANLPSTPLALVATLGAGTSLVTPMGAATGAITGAGLYATVNLLKKKNRLKFYATTLSAIDKGIKAYSSDKNVVAQLKADRLVIVDLINETRQEEE